ncbi:MAG: hypothetical protein ACLQQ4_05075 [Bacteroidia bacterium]
MIRVYVNNYYLVIIWLFIINVCTFVCTFKNKLSKTNIYESGKNYNRSKARKSFYRISSLYILRLIYDCNSELRNPTKYGYLLKYLESESMNENISAIRQLFDIAYLIYEKSDYEGGFAERDFLKGKDTYEKIFKAIKISLRKEIQTFFN